MCKDKLGSGSEPSRSQTIFGNETDHSAAANYACVRVCAGQSGALFESCICGTGILYVILLAGSASHEDRRYAMRDMVWQQRPFLPTGHAY